MPLQLHTSEDGKRPLPELCIEVWKPTRFTVHGSREHAIEGCSFIKPSEFERQCPANRRYDRCRRSRDQDGVCIWSRVSRPLYLCNEWLLTRTVSRSQASNPTPLHTKCIRISVGVLSPCVTKCRPRVCQSMGIHEACDTRITRASGRKLRLYIADGD